MFKNELKIKWQKTLVQFIFNHCALLLFLYNLVFLSFRSQNSSVSNISEQSNNDKRKNEICEEHSIDPMNSKYMEMIKQRRKIEV